MDWLGPDIESIGREKAGIFRAGRPAIFGSRDMPASIAEVAQQLGTPLYRLGRDFDWSRDSDASGEMRGARWSWQGRNSSYKDLPRPALAGELQFDNASAVLCALECLSTRLPVTREAIERGLQTVTLPGRFQIIRRSEPVATEWILDVAHNPAAAQALAGQLANQPAGGRTLAVCGILGDKDIEGVAAALRGGFDAWIVVGLDSPRAVPLIDLSQRLVSSGANVIASADSVPKGCEIAETMARAGDRIVAFGSFLTVGPALEWLQARR
jgi:dihydrofolate synthase/folylpolyglutamate synthase